MCDVKFCQSDNTNLFHSPMDTKQLQKWKSLLNIDSDVFFVCGSHFEKKFLCSNNTLMNTAEPTLNLTKQSSDECQSCLKVFEGESWKNLICVQYQKVFHQLVGMELYGGFICSTCVNALLTFNRFRNNIRANLRDNRQPKEKVKEPPMTTTIQSAQDTFLITEIKTEPEEFYSEESFMPPQKVSATRKPLLKFSLPSDPPLPLQIAVPTKGFKCQFCENRFIERAFVLAHIKQRHTFNCPCCPCSFPYKISQIKHTMATHGSSEVQESRQVKRNFSNFRLECEICKLKFLDEKSLSYHVAMKHEVKEEEKVEEETLGKRLKLGSQIIIKHVKGEGSFVLDEMKNQVLPRSQIKPRSRVTIKNVFVPFKSPPSLQTIKKPAQHISVLVNKIRPKGIEVKKKSPSPPPFINLQENDPNGIPCLDCGLLLLPDRLLHHRREFHEKTLPFTCDICDAVLRSKASTITHMKVEHLPVATHKCEFCLALYDCRFTLIKHLNKMHSDGSEGKRFICHFCDKAYKTVQEMTDHRKAHYDYRFKRRAKKPTKTILKYKF